MTIFNSYVSLPEGTMHFFSAKMGSRESFAMSIPGLSLAPKENSVEIPRRCRPAFTRLLAEVIIYTKKMSFFYLWVKIVPQSVVVVAVRALEPNVQHLSKQQLFAVARA